ncbi:hypothetical protein [Portibacter lacus]|uniref:Uncharacterized protein n=1 Tax=Portibacter lacus TaxID=1099794 RepID=A0AA37SQ89_9BACT|nr:hypothetical protein [Portibacter lacus]GLR18047.1 hypothetical protein GCM10007940_26620 [Portibacter lacus]
MICITLNGQNNGIYKKLYSSIYLSNASSNNYLKKQRNHKPALKSLESNFYTDQSARSRSKAYSISRNIYNYSNSLELKQRVVEDHLEACLSDRSPYLRFRLSNHLIHFDKKDFNDHAISMLKELIETDRNKKHFIVIAGYKEIDEVLPNISKYTEEDILESWDVVQGLARVGNPEALAICKRIMEEYPLDKRFFDRFLPGLAFTNDRMVFDLIIEEILSDENTELIGQRLKDYQRYFMLKNIIPLMYEYPYRFVDESQLMEDEFYHQLHFAMDWLEKNKETYTLIHVESPMKQKESPYINKDITSFSF